MRRVLLALVLLLAVPAAQGARLVSTLSNDSIQISSSFDGETLSLFDPEEEAFEPIRPQLYRALAYTAAYASDMQGMRRALKKLLAQDVRLLGGFMTKKTHPLLQKEAKKMLEQSGQVPRKMVVQRRI